MKIFFKKEGNYEITYEGSDSTELKRKNTKERRRDVYMDIWLLHSKQPRTSSTLVDDVLGCLEEIEPRKDKEEWENPI